MKKFNEQYEKFMEDLIPGGLGDDKGPKDLVELHKKLFPEITVAIIEDQISKGIKVEMEHTKDKSKAREIAIDHLVEHPLYYNFHDNMERKMDLDKRARKEKDD